MTVKLISSKIMMKRNPEKALMELPRIHLFYVSILLYHIDLFKTYGLFFTAQINSRLTTPT